MPLGGLLCYLVKCAKSDATMKKVYGAFIDYAAAVRKYHFRSVQAYSRLRQ